MIKIDHLTKQIPGGPKVLSDISFVAHKGEFVSIVGGSGSGKSMLLKCLALREKWTQGKYMVEGVDVLANFFLQDRVKFEESSHFWRKSQFCLQAGQL